MKADNIIYLCRILIGEDWYDYFYPEFVESLFIGNPGFNELSKLKKEGWTTNDLCNHPIYGLYVNLCEYHYNIDLLIKLIKLSDYITDEEIIDLLFDILAINYEPII